MSGGTLGPFGGCECVSHHDLKATAHRAYADQ